MKSFNNPVDMWALGCTAAEMLCRKPLFPGNSQIGMIRLIFHTIGKPSEGIFGAFAILLAAFASV